MFFSRRSLRDVSPHYLRGRGTGAISALDGRSPNLWSSSMSATRLGVGRSRQCRRCVARRKLRLFDDKILVAREGAAGSGDHYRACGRAAGNYYRQVGVGEHFETCGCDPIEGHAGCASQSLPENLCRAANFAGGLYESDEGTEAHVEAVDGSESVRPAGLGGSIQQPIGVLQEPCEGRFTDWSGKAKQQLVGASRRNLEQRSEPGAATFQGCAIQIAIRRLHQTAQRLPAIMRTGSTEKIQYRRPQ